MLPSAAMNKYEMWMPDNRYADMVMQRLLVTPRDNTSSWVGAPPQAAAGGDGADDKKQRRKRGGKGKKKGKTKEKQRKISKPGCIPLCSKKGFLGYP